MKIVLWKLRILSIKKSIRYKDVKIAIHANMHRWLFDLYRLATLAISKGRLGSIQCALASFKERLAALIRRL